ncbi:MAG: tRNA (N(6)-L-threonylcarbamoyladenosine(37)-C(2))-methylthiotransferase [Nanoarchaeota archaeon]|nr:tRNA (N(6)-L-threonylcarbamoyladenosine(37)-C(2))-methylthiotransferase [Nanoarchaeota archaeon]
MKTPHFLYIETYGCSANQNNSEIIKGKLINAGTELVSNPEIADIILINTCIVKEPTENSIKQRIIDLEKLNKPIIIAGCMPQVRHAWLNNQKNVFLLGISHIKEITKLIRRIIENKYDSKEFLSTPHELKVNCSKIRQNKLIGITQISEGCLGNCNFCLVNQVKGRLFSYPEEEIIRNIQNDLKQGCKEIWLTSQDLASYGLESNDKTAFISLLKEILKINSKFKLRLGMMNPNHILPILPSLLEIYKHEKVYKFLHVPVQSGSNNILKAMNRKYSKQDFIEIVKKFRKEFPDSIIATDIITAFPGEIEKDFRETLELIKETKPDVMNITRYWPMQGTRAAKLEQIDRRTASNRALEVQKLHLKISEENFKKYECKTIEVFINEQEGTNCLARDENYRLIVIKSDKKLLGKILNVKIKKAFPHYLLAEVA